MRKHAKLTLPISDRKMLVAMFLRGMSISDIASECELTRQTVESTLREGYDGLLALLQTKAKEETCQTH